MGQSSGLSLFLFSVSENFVERRSGSTSCSTELRVSHACRITLFLKEDAEEMLEEAKLSGLIKQYSEFISFPIKLWSTDSVPKQVEDAEATAKAQAEADAKAKEEGKEVRIPRHLLRRAAL